MANILLFSGCRRRARRLAHLITGHSLTLCWDLETVTSLLNPAGDEKEGDDSWVYHDGLIIDGGQERSEDLMAVLSHERFQPIASLILLCMPSLHNEVMHRRLDLLKSVRGISEIALCLIPHQEELSSEDGITFDLNESLFLGWLLNRQNPIPFPFAEHCTLPLDSSYPFANPGLREVARLLGGWEHFKQAIDWDAFLNSDSDIYPILAYLEQKGNRFLKRPELFPLHAMTFLEYRHKHSRMSRLNCIWARLLAKLPPSALANLN